MQKQPSISPLFSRNFREEGPVTICFLGDSITQGCFELGVCDLNAVYHNQLRMLLAEKYPSLPVNIINAGRGGDNTQEALARLDRDVISHYPDIVVIYLGTNDVWGTTDGFQEGMTAIIERLLTEGCYIVLMTGTHMNKAVRPHLTPEMAEIAEKMAVRQNEGHCLAVFEITRKLAETYGLPLVDIYAHYDELAAQGVDTDTLLANGINHPSREMHAVFAEKLFTLLTTN